MELPSENGAKVANEWQPMSALIWVGPSSRCISLIAEKTGRSGQPVQNAGGRGGKRAERGGGFCLVRDQPARLFRDGVGVDAFRPRLLQERSQTFEQHIGGIFAGLRQQALAEHAGLDVGAAQFDVDRLLDIVGIAFFDDQHGASCPRRTRASPPAPADRRR